MKISTNWLKEITELDKNLSAKEIGEKLTLHTAELEEIEDKSQIFAKIYAGSLISKKIHPNSKKLNIGQFDLGKLGKKQIIFGKVHELFENKVYPIAIDGAVLKNEIIIKTSEICGEKSEGMVCDNLELGMKNNDLLEFSEKHIGKNLCEICPEFSDQILDIDNKSLTHRPDLMGHRGFSRELNVIFKGKKDPQDFFNFTKPKKLKNSKPLEVEIKTQKCLRFISGRIENVFVQKSSLKNMIKLENLGIRSISNFVDITNLIMLEHGQPMHVFDADKIRGKIIIRQAKNGEKLLALDDEEYELTDQDVVIADEEKVLSIAGIMGGLSSSVNFETKNIVFESACFDPVSIRKTSNRLGLRSESSMRFEKTLDPENCEPAIFNAISMAQTFSQNSQISDIFDNFSQNYEEKILQISVEEINKYSGLSLSKQQIREILEGLGFIIKNDENKVLTIKIPSWRNTKDIEISVDLIEEIVRIFGLKNIPESFPILKIESPKINDIRNLEWKIREFLADNNFSEVYLNSFVSSQDKDFLENENHISTINSSNKEFTFLRQTLISNFLQIIEPELREHKTLNLFEIGHIFSQKFPEKNNLAIVSAQIGKNNDSFYDLKSVFCELLEKIGLEKELEFLPKNNINNFLHPFQSAEILFKNQKIGFIGSISPLKNPVENSSIFALEIDLEILNELVKNEAKKYKKLSIFPTVNRDLSIVLDKNILMSDIEKISRNSSSFLQKFDLFDDYLDDKYLGRNSKNLSFHLTFQSNEKTLSGEEIDKEFNKIVDNLFEKFQAKLRLDFDNEKK